MVQKYPAENFWRHVSTQDLLDTLSIQQERTFWTITTQSQFAGKVKATCHYLAVQPAAYKASV